MADSTSISDVIIWASPLVGGLALYLAHDAFTSVKDDLKELRERQVKTREDLADLRADVKVANDSINAISRNVDAAVSSVKAVDQRSGDTREVQMFMRTLENKMSVSETNYGKVILILKKVVTILRPKMTQDPTQGP